MEKNKVGARVSGNGKENASSGVGKGKSARKCQGEQSAKAGKSLRKGLEEITLENTMIEDVDQAAMGTPYSVSSKDTQEPTIVDLME